MTAANDLAVRRSWKTPASNSSTKTAAGQGYGFASDHVQKSEVLNAAQSVLPGAASRQSENDEGDGHTSRRGHLFYSHKPTMTSDGWPDRRPTRIRLTYLTAHWLLVCPGKSHPAPCHPPRRGENGRKTARQNFSVRKFGRVRSSPKADMCSATMDVRVSANSGHRLNHSDLVQTSAIGGNLFAVALSAFSPRFGSDRQVFAGPVLRNGQGLAGPANGIAVLA